MKYSTLILIGIISAGTAWPEGRQRFLTSRSITPPFPGTELVRQFAGALKLDEVRPPINTRWEVAYSGCINRETPDRFVDPACSDRFRETGFVILHGAYYWQSGDKYRSSDWFPRKTYEITHAEFKYDPAKRIITYNVGIKFSDACYGNNCQEAPELVFSILGNFVNTEVISQK